MSGKTERASALFSAVLGAAVAAACLDAVVTLVRSPSLFSNKQIVLGAAADLLFCAGALALGGTLFVLFAILFAGRSSVTTLLARPVVFAELLWRGKDRGAAVGSALGRFTGFLVGLAVFAATLYGGSYVAVEEFNEPSRTSLFIAGVGLVAAALGYSLGVQTGARWLVPLFVYLGGKTAHLGRSALCVMVGVPATGAIILATRADDAFGTFDPAPIAVLLTFLLLLSVATSWFGRTPRRLPPPGWPAAAGALALALAVALASLVPPSRGPLDRAGALGAHVYRGALFALDMDGDLFAWLIGGDCHPLDPNANPFAVEIPGNGYDENCDGSDIPISSSGYADPLHVLGPAPEELVVPRGNILLVIIDAARKDRLPAYGYHRNTMPALERFGSGALVFDNFFAASNHTSVSMPAMFTGLFPSVFPGVLRRSWSTFRVSKSFKPLHLRLEKRGYRTVMYAGHRMSGFLRGYDFVNKRGKERVPADELSSLAMEELLTIGGSPSKPVLFGVHFIDAHHPYLAPVDADCFGETDSDRYDAELAFVDEALVPILDLMETEEYRDWLVVVTSDHGEGHNEHGTPHHGYSLYDEEVRVPLVMRVPGVEPGRRRLATSQLDLLPTIQEWTGGAMAKGLPGYSLLHLAGSGPLPASERRVVFAESFRDGNTYAALDGRYSLIYHRAEGIFELYDEEVDPGQSSNLYYRGADLVLESLLRTHIRASRERLAENKERRAKKKALKKKAKKKKALKKARKKKRKKRKKK